MCDRALRKRRLESKVPWVTAETRERALREIQEREQLDSTGF